MAERPECLPDPTDSALGYVVGFSFVGIIMTPILVSLADTLLGASATVIGSVAGGGAFIGGAIIFILLMPSFTCKAGTYDGCVAGVVNAIDLGIESGNSAFPWLERHPGVQLVTKSMYWDFLIKPETLEDSPPSGVRCIPTGRHSPYIMCYFRSETLCNASEGAVLGGVGGGIAGILTSIAVVDAIACATVILCLLALLLTLVIGAAAVVIGMLVGGQAGAASGTTTEVEDTEEGVALQVGDYVTLKGKFWYGTQQGERIGWFITETAIHGRSTGSPPFSFADPDANLTNDDCPVSDIPM